MSETPEFLDIIDSLKDVVNFKESPSEFKKSFYSMSSRRARLFAAYLCYSQVDGDLDGFFSGSLGVMAPEAVRALQAINLPKAAGVLMKAMASISNPYERDLERRQILLRKRFHDFDDHEERFREFIRTENGGLIAAANAYAASIQRLPVPSTYVEEVTSIDARGGETLLSPLTVCYGRISKFTAPVLAEIAKSKADIDPVLATEATFKTFSRLSTTTGSIAFVFTPDDQGKDRDGKAFAYRAGQEMVFWSGYALGVLGPKRVNMFTTESFDLPPVFKGASIPVRPYAMFTKLVRELR